MNIQNATEFYKCNLTLRVGDISQDTTVANYPITNSIGTINSTRTAYTWYNIDLHQILGDLYEKFDYFNLRVSAIQGDAGIGAYGSTTDFNCYFQMTGPTFYNSSYDVADQKTTNTTTVANHVFTRNLPFTIFYNDVFISTFRKQPTLDLTINLLRVANDAQPGTVGGSLYPMINFYLNIIPVEYPTHKKDLQVY